VVWAVDMVFWAGQLRVHLSQLCGPNVFILGVSNDVFNKLQLSFFAINKLQLPVTNI
jgi:hypothetical protein